MRHLIKLAAGLILLLLAGQAFYRWRERTTQRIIRRVFRRKVVVITGASGGIGRAYAWALARHGAHLVLAARRTDRLNALAAELNIWAASVLVVPTDVADPDQRAHLIRTTLDAHGRVDILINNAGVGNASPFGDLAPEALRQMLAVNLEAPLQFSRSVLPGMLAAGSGAIVNVSSLAGRVALPGGIAYAATKFGLTGFSEALNRELAGTGVLVVSVEPGYTATERTDERTRFGIPLLKPEYIAEQTLRALALRQPWLPLGGADLVFALIFFRLPGLLDSLLKLGFRVGNP